MDHVAIVLIDTQTLAHAVGETGLLSPAALRSAASHNPESDEVGYEEAGNLGQEEDHHPDVGS